MKRRFLLIAMCFMLMPFCSNAFALSVGFDGNGASTFTTIDHVVYQTDTGLSVGFVGGRTVPSVDSAYDVDFILQGKVGTASLNGSQVDIAPVPFTNEWTFTSRFTETVISQFTDATGEHAIFSHGEDLSSTFNMYVDTARNSDPNTATGYSDGTPILSGHLLSVFSSFDAAAPGTLGTGSFNVKVAIDSWDHNYLDLPAGYPSFFTITTGTLNLPPTFSPATMWDGTPTNTGISLKFDGSTDFGVVPEPGTLVLLGLGLIG